MPNLSTTYLGLHLSSPLVPSASPLSRNVETIKRLEDAGAAAVVLYSLFEQIDLESHILNHYLSASAESSWEAPSYYPKPDQYMLHPEQYLNTSAGRRRRSVSESSPASMASRRAAGPATPGLIEQAGADALELNVYFVPTDPFLSSAEIEQSAVECRPRGEGERRDPRWR